MSDIVERLRAMESRTDAIMWGDLKPLFGEAADEIDRLRAENRTIRRHWCVAYAGVVGAYTDDGEAYDSRERPHIDFVRDPLEVIEAKMHERFVAALVAKGTP